MPPDLDQQEYCKLCEKSFPSWDALLLHKIESKKHICCLFCGQDFKTLKGCNGHQHQYHAAQQNLKCAGCGMDFVRVGSYISHIEQQQCPVIHASIFEVRRAEKEKAAREKMDKGKTVENSISAYQATDTSSFNNGSLAFEDKGPTKTSWEEWADDNASIQISEKDFPALPPQNFQNEGSNGPGSPSGPPDKLNQENLAWKMQKDLFPYLPDKPIDYSKKLLAGITVNPSTQKEEFHPFDPDNPAFKIQDYYNPISGKYSCPWPGCRKLQNHTPGLIQHLKSPAHMDAKLRCPSCLRQYRSATALVQHAESQAIKCQIRDSAEYKIAVDQITGGFVDTAGRHLDNTVRYIAPTTVLEGASLQVQGFEAHVANANANYWADAAKKREEKIKAAADNANW